MNTLEKVKKSRKPHGCSWCGEEIEVSSEYLFYEYFGDDGITTVRLHPECEEPLNAVAAVEGPEFDFMPGDHARGMEA